MVQLVQCHKASHTRLLHPSSTSQRNPTLSPVRVSSPFSALFFLNHLLTQFLLLLAKIRNLLVNLENLQILLNLEYFLLRNFLKIIFFLPSTELLLNLNLQQNLILYLQKNSSSDHSLLLHHHLGLENQLDLNHLLSPSGFRKIEQIRDLQILTRYHLYYFQIRLHS